MDMHRRSNIPGATRRFGCGFPPIDLRALVHEVAQTSQHVVLDKVTVSVECIIIHHGTMAM